MSKFTVNLTCDNEAFKPRPETEIARILRVIANLIEGQGLSGFYETIHDINGNDVGRFAIKNSDGSNWNPSWDYSRGLVSEDPAHDREGEDK